MDPSAPVRLASLAGAVASVTVASVTVASVTELWAGVVAAASDGPLLLGPPVGGGAPPDSSEPAGPAPVPAVGPPFGGVRRPIQA
jgi:hypothetical protein